MESYGSMYAEQQFLGKGSFGKVYKVINNHSLNVFAAKKIDLLGLTPQQLHQTHQQIDIHRSLHHPNIIQLYEHYWQQNQLIIVMEYCEYGDLEFYIRKRATAIEKGQGTGFSEEVVMNLFIQILFGLNYLHEQKIVHRDIKASNIFVDSEGRAKLADFGIAKVIDHTMRTHTKALGTPRYLSPELCANKPPTTKSDIWALGCVLYELCELKPAFDGNNVLALATMIANNEVSNINFHNYSENLNALIHWMMQKQAEKRPEASEILQLTFISKYTNKFSSPTKKKQQSPSKINPTSHIKQKCIAALGVQKYQQIYAYVAHLIQTLKREDKEIELTLQKNYGQQEYQLAKAIFHVILSEQQF